MISVMKPGSFGHLPLINAFALLVYVPVSPGKAFGFFPACLALALVIQIFSWLSCGARRISLMASQIMPGLVFLVQWMFLPSILPLSSALITCLFRLPKSVLKGALCVGLGFGSVFFLAFPGFQIFSDIPMLFSALIVLLKNSLFDKFQFQTPRKIRRDIYATW